MNPVPTFRALVAVSMIWMSLSGFAFAQQEQEQRQTLVLHSYLVSPAWISNVKRSMGNSDGLIQFLPFDTSDAEALQRAIERADLILVDLPHVSVVATFLEKAGPKLKSSGVPYVLIADTATVRSGSSIQAGELPDQAGVPESWANRVREYYRLGGKQNTRHLTQALASPLDRELPASAQMPEQGIYHPAWPTIETDLPTAIDRFADDAFPIAAIAINPSTLSSGDTVWLDALIHSLANHQVNAYAFYGPRKNDNRFTELTCVRRDESLVPLADLIINAALVFRPQQRKLELDAIGIPVIQTLPALAVDKAQWRASEDGLALADMSYYYASSELAGMVDPILITARDANTGMLNPIGDQIDALTKKVASLCELRRTDRAERRIAMVVYNYPPGESNFGASFLNVPKSIVNVLSEMQKTGYTTTTIDEDVLTKKMQQALRSLYEPTTSENQQSPDDFAFLSLVDYEAWFASLPQTTRTRIDSYWGSPAQMAVKKNGQTGFVIPSLQLGNVCLLPQPLRHEITTATGDALRKKRIGHQSTVPLSHKYLATYLYLKQTWKANAVVHFGTHGTLEWAPGKRRALSADDDPLLAIGALPNIYPYIMDNLGEATTAKRRGRATMISHLTPMFTPAGFRPGLHDMHDLMHDWETITDGPVRSQMEKQLIESFVDHRLDLDLDWNVDEIASDFHGFMEKLHPYLDDIAQSAQPQGLAVLGAVPSEQRRFGMVMQMLRKPLIDALGEDIDEVFLLDAEKVTNSRPARWLRLALVDAEAASKLDLRRIDALDDAKQTSVPNRASGKELDPKRLLELARRAQQLDASLQTNVEIAALLDALDGKHVQSSYGGDPVRNPESLPTGRNLYGFDPTRVPTEQAWQIGVGVLDEWIQTYRASHEGKFPQRIAFTMWAGETMRHHGVMETQVFHAMGVSPKWNASGRMTGFDVVPASELGRPRIDVLLSVTGSYRDQFPHLMCLIDQAVQKVAEIKEPGNRVAEQTSRLRTRLLESGTSSQDARRRSTARVFSNESGNYGTGLNDATYASDLWSSQTRGGGDAEMAELFVRRMGHAYGEGLSGIAAGDLFREQLATIDAAFLSRSSNTYGVLTSDDAYAYLGGLSLAARQASGRSPELVVQNLRDESEVIFDPASRAIAKEMQTRYLHPQWIAAQQSEGYSGTLQVLKATQFLWGWQTIAPETVREDQWQSLVDTYVNDQYELGTREWLETQNPAAMAQMLERMIDAVRLDYWHPDSETQQTLFAAYQAARKKSELIESNRLVAQFVDTVLASPPQQVVRGIELEATTSDVEVAPKPKSTRYGPRYAIAGVCALLLAGAWREWRRPRMNGDDNDA